jgi:hypothetical protein
MNAGFPLGQLEGLNSFQRIQLAGLAAKFAPTKK